MDKPSKRFELNTTDWKKAGETALIFLAPSLISFIVTLTPAIDTIIPDTTGKLIFLALLKWGLDQVLGLLRRYVAGKEAK